MVVFSLTFVRHGETLYNRKKIIQGQTDIPLSQVGLQQAKMVASRLAEESFTHVFSSDLSRALQTAQTIVEGSRACKCSIMKDKRLRERKFGVLEGKYSKEFAAAAKEANVNVAHYSPQGAESNQQMQERAVSFFGDLCKQLIAYVNENDESDYIAGSVKLRHGGSLGRNSGHVKNRLLSSRRSQSFCGIASVGNDSSEVDVQIEYSSSDQKKRKYNEDTQICHHPEKDKQCKDTMGNNQQSQYLSNESETDSLVNTVIGRSNSSSSSGYASLPDTTEKDNEDLTEKDLNTSPVKNSSSDSLFTSTASDLSSEGNLGSAENIFTEVCPAVVTQSGETSYCPNVSLSPLLAHRLSSVSSISSGRNSSFDDMDGLPPSLADVLVVSHGGMIKEIIRYFVEKLGCKIPGGKNHGLKVCSNCSLSKFTITIHESNELATVSCILINDKDHLKDVDTFDLDLAL